LVEIEPLPSLMPPLQAAEPWVFIGLSPFVSIHSDVSAKQQTEGVRDCAPMLLLLRRE
jgi:hypothetical protein